MSSTIDTNANANANEIAANEIAANEIAANEVAANEIAANEIPANEIAEPQEECQQLKNIKFKNMLINGVSQTKQKVQSKKENIDLFLDKESKLNKKESWNKLDKTDKIKRIIDYVNQSAAKFSLNATEIEEYRRYLIDCLDKKKLQHVKDVQYDVTNGKIIIIPNLLFNTVNRKFTFKRNEKKTSTVKSLGSGDKTKKVIIDK
jgi:hypothetical protein